MPPAAMDHELQDDRAGKAIHLAFIALMMNPGLRAGLAGTGRCLASLQLSLGIRRVRQKKTYRQDTIGALITT